MRSRYVGRLLLTLGLLVGVAASVGLLVGFEPARLPPALLNVAAYKLTFIAALGLLAAGAVFLRLSRRTAPRVPTSDDAKPRIREHEHMIGQPRWSSGSATATGAGEDAGKARRQRWV